MHFLWFVRVHYKIHDAAIYIMAPHRQGYIPQTAMHPDNVGAHGKKNCSSRIDSFSAVSAVERYWSQP